MPVVIAQVGPLLGIVAGMLGTEVVVADTGFGIPWVEDGSGSDLDNVDLEDNLGEGIDRVDSIYDLCLYHHYLDLFLYPTSFLYRLLVHPLLGPYCHYCPTVFCNHERNSLVPVPYYHCIPVYFLHGLGHLYCLGYVPPPRPRDPLSLPLPRPL